MIKVFQMAVNGVSTDRFYEAHTAEKAIEDFKKDYIEDFGSELDMTGVEAILYDEYEDW